MLDSLNNKAFKKLNADRAVKSEMHCVRCIAQRGFTLIELLLVIAIIGSLAAIILVILKPADRIAKANNSKRKADVDAIKYAIDTYGLDNGGTEYDLTICTNTI